MTNDMEVLIEKVARAIDREAFVTASPHRQAEARDKAKAAIRATLKGVRASNPPMNVAVLEAMDNPTIENPGSAAWDWLVAQRAAIDALLSQLKE